MSGTERAGSCIRGIDQKILASTIVSIGYDIIKNIICPLVGISNVMAVLYLVSPSDYLIGRDKEEDDDLFKEFKKQFLARYGLDEGRITGMCAHSSIVLYTVVVLEYGDPVKVEAALSKGTDD